MVGDGGSFGGDDGLEFGDTSVFTNNIGFVFWQR
jgi:hypothetical protein